MKLLLPAIFIAGLSLTASAQSKLNGQAGLLVYDYELAKISAVDESSRRDILRLPQQQQRVDLLIEVADAANLADVEAIGANVQWVEGSIVALDINVANIEQLAELDNVLYVEYTPNFRANLDYARPASNVTTAQSGFEFNGATYAFDGSGIVTGLMDQGIDPNHINFKDANGDSRVKAVYRFSSTTSSNAASFVTPDQISMFTSDDMSTSHGTHVAGIMAGGYNSDGKYAYISSPDGSKTTQKEGPIPYYGVAPKSDIVMCCGPFSSTTVTAALRKIFDYAESVGKPAVANLSLGNNAGPHDGSELYCQSLTSQADRGIICISAGNEGRDDVFLNQKFDASTTELKTFITGNKGTGTVEVWGNNDQPFGLRVILFDSNGTITDVFSIDQVGTANSTSSSLFKTNYSGSISANATVNRNNNRYNVAVSLSSVAQTKTGQSLGIIITGADGQEVWVYGNSSTSDALTFTSNSRSGWTSGSAAGTINSLACAQGVISIGSYNSRRTWGYLGKTGTVYYPTQNPVGEISDFSSWGKTFQGLQLPYVCAPGSVLISSFNSYYVAAQGSSEMSASATVDDTTYYWGAMQGTSMSSPYAAGVVALWLQVAPDLTYSQVIDIIQKTSVEPTIVVDPFNPSAADETRARWGAGKIDAVEGLKEVLTNYAGIENIFADDSRQLILTPIGEGYNVFVAGENALQLSVVDLRGATVTTAAAEGNEATISTASLAPGIYVLTITGDNTRYTRKIAVN